MALFRFFFLQMTVRYFRGVTNAATRLWFAPIGPVLVAIAIWAVATRQHPALMWSVFIAGSAIMRIQASMVEKCPWKSLRNGALLILAGMAFSGFVLRNVVWTAVGVVIALALLWLQYQHDQYLEGRGLSKEEPGTYAEQLQRMRDAG